MQVTNNMVLTGELLQRDYLEWNLFEIRHNVDSFQNGEWGQPQLEQRELSFNWVKKVVPNCPANAAYDLMAVLTDILKSLTPEALVDGETFRFLNFFLEVAGNTRSTGTVTPLFYPHVECFF